MKEASIFTLYPFFNLTLIDVKKKIGGMTRTCLLFDGMVVRVSRHFFL